MAKVEVGNLTSEECNALFRELLDAMHPAEIATAINEVMDDVDREEIKESIIL